MAKIEITGFVDDQLVGTNGQYGLKVSEPHRKRQDDDTYKTVARTFHRVKGNATTGFVKGDRVTVVGRQVTETYTAGGETKYSLVVWADTVAYAERSGATAAEPAAWDGPPVQEDTWATTETPF